MKAIEVYHGSDGALTTRFYQELGKHGPAGLLAINLFRAHKCSARAKVYRGRAGRGERSYRDLAYERKDWSIRQLADVLLRHGDALAITWGWKHDPAQPFHCWVLYIDLPAGQASFHVASRGHGPAYAGDWDGLHSSVERILAFCDALLTTAAPAPSVDTCGSGHDERVEQVGAFFEVDREEAERVTELFDG